MISIGTYLVLCMVVIMLPLILGAIIASFERIHTLGINLMMLTVVTFLAVAGLTFYLSTVIEESEPYPMEYGEEEFQTYTSDLRDFKLVVSSDYDEMTIVVTMVTETRWFVQDELVKDIIIYIPEDYHGSP